MNDTAKPAHVHIKVQKKLDGNLRIIDARGRDIPGIIGCDVSMRPGVPALMRVNLAAGVFEAEGVPIWSMMDPNSGRFRPVLSVTWGDTNETWEPPLPFPVAQPQPAAPSEPPPEGGTQEPGAETHPQGA